MVFRGVLLTTLGLIAIQVAAQSAIPARAGLIHLSEGAVFLDGRRMDPVRGRFPEIPEGSRLATTTGKVEVLLAPTIFLWLGNHSAIRLQRNSLADTRIELLEGSAVLQSSELPSENSVTVIEKEAQVRLSGGSLYRMDAAPSQLTVRNGRATVVEPKGSLVVSGSQRLTFATGLITTLKKEEDDGLDQWAQERRRAIAADNVKRLRAENAANPTKKAPQNRSGPYRRGVMTFPRRSF